jgi:predicted anti-sigma-YlaC factor YlaD
MRMLISPPLQAKFGLLTLLVLGTAVLSACSMRQYAADRAADLLAGESLAFSSDDDPELIREAAPFSLKLLEMAIAERPKHVSILLTASRGFCQYAYAFVQQRADASEDQDVNAAYRLRARAQRLYRRARDYGLRGLEVDHPEFGEGLRHNSALTLANTTAADVPLLYWTGAAWAAWIALSKDNSEVIADLPIVTALLQRALVLDEAFGAGALHTLFISLSAAQAGPMAELNRQARDHFKRAVALNAGQQAAPYIALAEVVAVAEQRRSEFESLLQQAIAINSDARPEWRLENLVMQQRARWLLGRTDKYFLE